MDSEIIPNTKIDQIYVAEHLRRGFGANITNSFPQLKSYYSNDKPAFFYGIWSVNDIYVLKSNKSLKIIIWSGGDINYDPPNRPPHINNIVMNNISQIKKLTNIFHISKSAFIDASLRYFDMKFLHIPFMAVQFDLYKPTIKGNCIYIYTAPSIRHYGSDFYEKIIEKYPDINFIFACCKESYESFVHNKNKKYLNQYKIQYYDEHTLINEIYPRCFLTLRLTIHDGIANTVQELGLMGIKSVHNGNGPSCLNYETIDDVCLHIENERKTIGTCDYELCNKMKNYLTLPEEFFRTNFYEKQLNHQSSITSLTYKIYKSNWPTFSEKMIDNVSQILKSGKVNQWTGSKVFDFEKKFSEYFGVKHSVAVFNGTVALELCLRAIDLQTDDQVIVSPRTFIASASSINICGGKPVFVDVDPVSQNITLDAIREAVTEKTKAVILVHLAGWPCDVEEIVEWCHSKGIYVIEDCAQAHGAKYNDKYVGTYGDINAWSFCQDKIISTGGEGGMITTNNTDLYLKAWSFKDHGKNYDKIFNSAPQKAGLFRWVHDSLGTNWRMTEMQASIGIDALEKLDQWVETRRKHATIFDQALKDLLLVRLTIPNNSYYHSYYKYYCFINEEFLIDDLTRNDIIAKINNAGIPCFQGTCGEVYKEKAYDMDLNLPITKKLTETSLMFLVDPTFAEQTIIEISQKVRDILSTVTRAN